MNERDAMTLLAEANPVRVEDLAPLDRPDLARRRRPSRRLVVAIAVLVTAVAASLIGAFAFGGASKKSSQPPVVMPAIPPAIQPLADASTILGAPVVLPDTALVTPSDADKTVETVCVPKDDTVDPGAGGCQVRVSFPAAGLTVTYATFPGMQSLRTSYEQIEQQNSGAELLSLGGVQALFVPQKESWIEFELGGTEISVEGAYDKAMLESVAQSIVDRAGTGKPPTRSAGVLIPNPVEPISLADAPEALGAPVVLPDTQLIGPADVGSVTKECPGAWGKTCEVSIKFPAQAVLIRYGLGGYPDPLNEYKAATGARGRVVYLSGIPALLIPQASDDRSGTASYIEFQLNGTSISVVGRNYDGPTVQAIAQSIVDRSK